MRLLEQSKDYVENGPIAVTALQSFHFDMGLGKVGLVEDVGTAECGVSRISEVVRVATLVGRVVRG